MSKGSRANFVKRHTGLSRQKATQSIKNLGPKSAQIAHDFNWPLKRADLYLIAKGADPECDHFEHVRHIDVRHCENCFTGFYYGLNKKGMLVTGSDTYCPECIEFYGGVEDCPNCGQEVLGELDDVMCQQCWEHLAR